MLPRALRTRRPSGEYRAMRLNGRAVTSAGGAPCCCGGAGSTCCFHMGWAPCGSDVQQDCVVGAELLWRLSYSGWRELSGAATTPYRFDYSGSQTDRYFTTGDGPTCAWFVRCEEYHRNYVFTQNGSTSESHTDECASTEATEVEWDGVLPGACSVLSMASYTFYEGAPIPPEISSQCVGDYREVWNGGTYSNHTVWASNCSVCNSMSGVVDFTFRNTSGTTVLIEHMEVALSVERIRECNEPPPAGVRASRREIPRPEPPVFLPAPLLDVRAPADAARTLLVPDKKVVVVDPAVVAYMEKAHRCTGCGG